jgi:hypothetical protein
MTHMGFVVAVLGCALVAALMEVQIEGEAGWASGLPTWRFENRLSRALLGNRVITGYHVYIHLLVLLLVHLPFLLGLAAWSWPAEFRVLAFVVLFWLVEDFLWFMVNPAYGVGAFRRSGIWWHSASWWGPLPRDYWIFLPVGVGLYLLSVLVA